ncbi:hypothetical protein SAMN05216503_2973 [Polaribacter sp. KT25b]|uniref:hypothetical protein n=1 Tax=Polaribacter sp. KT25b TaxID=1855336 RepID=UPI00087B4C03|nr:hypothetical protein [Polaribacter sp. KT25b]SDS41082.1 hypothetical protein SAMN05216503_2973 [Polaribacter sp. KT25b]
MKLFKKTYWLIYPILIIVFMSIFDLVYITDNFILKIGVCSVLAFIVSPRKKLILTETGKTKQITWLFLKKPISLD